MTEKLEFSHNSDCFSFIENSYVLQNWGLFLQNSDSWELCL